MSQGNMIKILDTTLRDGEQTSGILFRTAEKVQIAKALENIHVNIIEAGFPAVSKGAFEAVSAVAEAVKESVVCVFSRCRDKDISAAEEATQKSRMRRLHLFMPTSRIHIENKLKLKPEEVIEIIRKYTLKARNLCDDVAFTFEDATRSDREFLFRAVETAIKAGAGTIQLPDTVGYASVREYGRMFRDVIEHVPGADNVILAAHTHNDLGLASAESLEAVICGARQVDCTINGLGERAGNAPLDEIVMGLRVRNDEYGFDSEIDISGLYRVSRLVSNITGIEPPPNKPIVGSNAFCHTAGIHQDGVIQDPRTYEIMDPEELGIPKKSLPLTKLSGRHALMTRAEQLGFKLSEKDIDSVFTAFKSFAEIRKEVDDRDMVAILRSNKQISSGLYRLVSFQLLSGNNLITTATITLLKKGIEYTEAACAAGPAEACLLAINKLTGMNPEILQYNLNSVSEGQDALGEVVVRARFRNETVLGRGVSINILEANCLAIINACNQYAELFKLE